MKSPFPGMDPYLESHWGDIHQSLVIYIRDQLQGQLPSDLRARVEERVFLQSRDEILRTLVPDVRISERVVPVRSIATRSVPHMEYDDEGPVATLTTQPLTIEFREAEHETVTESFLEIREASTGGRVVTTIEVLSLANKYGAEGQTQYRRKVRELRQSGVGLVEINLLRAGPCCMVLDEIFIPVSHRTPYLTSVVRGWNWLAAEIYRMPLREKLPVIAVPLREHEKDVTLDLQALISQCYDRGGYDDINYRDEPVPNLKESDHEWMNRLLVESGHRTKSNVSSRTN